MYTPPFGPALEAALKETVQGGLLQVCKGRIIQPQFFCCVSGTNVGVNKDPVALIIMQTQACVGDAICLDYSHSWSPSSTIVRWDVDWGDGNTSGNAAWPDAGSICHPLGGYQFAGVYTVKLTVTDIIDATGSAEVEVNIVYCPQIPLPVYCGCGASGVWFSHNCGAAWENRGGGVLDDEEVYDLKVSPFDKAIWVGDAISGYFDTDHIELWCASEIGLHKTLNGGLNWDEVNLPRPEVGVPIPDAKSIIPSIYDRNEWYIIAETATRVYIYRTIDDGETFTWIRLGSKQVGVVWGDVEGEVISTDDLAITNDGTELYISTTQLISGTVYALVRKYDGVSWSTVGNLIANTSFNNIVVDNSGNIYVSDTTTDRVYRLSGGTWSEIGRFNGDILNMSIGKSDGDLYICGNFTENVPDDSTDYDSRCAKYSGSWSPVGGNTQIGGKDIVNVQDIVQTVGGSIYIAVTPSPPTEYNGVAVLSGGSFVDAGAALSDPNCLFVHPITDYVYCATAFSTSNLSGKYYNGITWVNLPNKPGGVSANQVVYENFTTEVNGTIYLCGWYNLTPDQAKVWRLDGASWTQIKSWSFINNIQSIDMGFMIDGCLYVGNDTIASVYGIQRSCPTVAVYNVHLPDEGLTHISSMDASAEYIYAAMLVDGSDTPIVVRVYYDLTDFAQLYNPGVGTWGGVRGDYTTLKRVWLFGDFGSAKVLLGNEAGDSLVNVTEGGWGSSELVRPVLPSIFNSRDLVAFLNNALETWQTGSTGSAWEKMGDTDFALHCGDRDTINDLLVLIGRLDSGAEHLDASVDLGRNLFDADGANLTPNAPITAIQIV